MGYGLETSVALVLDPVHRCTVVGILHFEHSGILEMYIKCTSSQFNLMASSSPSQALCIDIRQFWRR